MYNPYKFIHHGTGVRWNDPENAEYGPDAPAHARTRYIVHSVNGSTSARATEDDDIVLIYDPAGNFGEAEVPAHELRPYRETLDEMTTRYVRRGDAFLLSMLKYADRRLQRAEKSKHEALEQLRELRKMNNEDTLRFKKDKVIKALNKRIESLETELKQTRRQLDFYMCAYLCLKNPTAKHLAELPSFDNRPEAIARFLLSCPSESPEASDPTVTVVAEDDNGQTLPVTGIWYDKENGTVRLTLETEFKQ